MGNANSYSKASSKKLKKELQTVSNLSARNFLLRRGYMGSSFTLPEYYDPQGFEKIKLAKINWSDRNPVKITKTLDIFTPKSYLSWRSFNFLNPYIFLHTVSELTQKNNWESIKSILTQETMVNNYSIPLLPLKPKETLSGRSISNWLQMSEKDLIKDCPEYDNLITTDIKNFYPTIYTHSIGWAIHSKKVMKSARLDYSLLGNKLDKLCQNSRDGQTNGIPVGSMTSDVIAEIILSDIDKKLTDKLKDLKIKDVLIFRYRDDYRILSKGESAGKKTLQALNKILQTEYDLHLNSDKTQAYSDIIEGSLRPWILEIKNSYLLRDVYYGKIPTKIDSNFLRDCLIETYRIQKKYANGRASVAILAKLGEYFFENPISLDLIIKDIPELISLLRKISLLREEVTPQVFLLLDILMTKVSGKREKRKILTNIKKVITGKSDQEYQLIWFYRLCLSQLPDTCEKILIDNDFCLLRIVDRKYYKNDYEIFDMTGIVKADITEMKKFNLIDRKKLSSLSNSPIRPDSINIFKY